ncbi:MAG: acyl-CoA dehydrogenase family protein [Arenicella sp.]|nr:acyl-CoA dehydrogenase family protein [Arenicella sp.]
MNFTPSQMQLELKESITRFIDSEYDQVERRNMLASAEGFSNVHWQRMAELGCFKALFKATDGGNGGTALDTMMLMEEIGKGLVIEPILASQILSGRLIVETCSESAKAKLLPQIISGALTYASGLYEPLGRYDLSYVSTRAYPRRTGFSLTGRKNFVLNGGDADKILISARTGGAENSKGGISLFLLDSDLEGLSIHRYKNIDSHAAAEVILDGVFVERSANIGELGQVLPGIEAAVDAATLALCAEAIGAMGELNRKTLEHCKTRKQFGVSLSSFQSLQHRMADMLIEYEQAKSSMMYAVVMSDENHGIAPKEISAAKYRVGIAARKIAQEAIQLHGASGVTDELDISHYFKRLTTIEVQFGNNDFHLNRFIELSREEEDIN